LLAAGAGAENFAALKAKMADTAQRSLRHYESIIAMPAAAARQRTAGTDS
jgi:hypothetical protein